METNAKKGLLGRAIATAAPEAKEFRKIDRIVRYRWGSGTPKFVQWV